MTVSLHNQVHRMCHYRNKAKSKPHNQNGQVVNKERLDFCNFENNYVTECSAGDYQLQVACNNCNAILCQYQAINGLDKNYQIADFRPTDDLFSYRLRPDKAIGLECRCGNTSINGSRDEALFDTEQSKFNLTEL